MTRRFLWAVSVLIIFLFVWDSAAYFEEPNPFAATKLYIYDSEDQAYSEVMVPWQAVELLPHPLAPKQKRHLERSLSRRYGQGRHGALARLLNKRAAWAPAYYLAALRHNRSDGGWYYLNRLRLYRDALLLSLLYPKARLMRSLLARLPCGLPVRGFAGMARLLYDKSVNELAFVRGGGYEGLAFAMDRCFGTKSNLSPRRQNILRQRVERRLPRYSPQKGSKGFFVAAVRALVKKRGLLSKFDKRAGRELHIYTTVDPSRQQLLAGQMERYFRVPPQGEGPDELAPVYARLRSAPPVQAAAAIYGKSGALRAVMGGVPGLSGAGYNRYLLSRRQISSTVKPFLYSLAMVHCGYHPATRLVDKPVDLKDKEGKAWRPQNHYHDYIGPVTLKQALVESINTIAVRLIQCTGKKLFADKLRRLFAQPGNNIRERVSPALSLSLGSVDLTPHELAQGYLTLMNLGRKTEPYAIRRVERASTVLYERPGIRTRERLYPAGQVASVRDMMQSVVQQGTASRYGRDAFTFEVAGKTGSSPSDSWFVGFNPEHLLLAWAGYDKPSASSIKELPLFTVVPFWVEVMSRLETSREFFVLPSKLIPKEFCRYEGCVDSPDCAYIRGFFVREADLPPCPEGG